jgi:16S rRNA processing protein RimM
MSPTSGDVRAGAEPAVEPRPLMTLGRISGVYGVRGWVRIHSYTEPRDNILGFGRWILLHRGERRVIEVEATRFASGSVLAKLAGVDDRDVARGWTGAEIAVERRELPPCGPGEYYWADLEGLAVVTPDGDRLGAVDHLIATGAHDVIVLDGAPGRMIPFVADRIVRKVDFDAGEIVVDWDPAYWD